tara:strand:- start:973 stop:1344 length:372 start_codon:yes stop_codon:yes gene_type:complete
MTPPGKNSDGNMAARRRVGARCEAIATEYFISRGYFVFHPWFGVGPIDLICVKATPPEILLLDIKADNARVQKGRNYATRISRVLTAHQRRLGVRLCYVNPKTREVHLVVHRGARRPAIPDDL